MEDKELQPTHQLACPSCQARRDEETTVLSSSSCSRQPQQQHHHSKLKKTLKFYFYIFALTVFETGIILLFALTILKFRTPKFHVHSSKLHHISVGTTINPSFNITFTAEFCVKNTNFGPFNYENTSVNFYYEDLVIGKAFVHRAQAKARSTRKFSVKVKLTSAKLRTNSIMFAQDLSSGILPITSEAKMRGRITILKLLKTNRSVNMNCNMNVVVRKRQIKNLTCK